MQVILHIFQLVINQFTVINIQNMYYAAYFPAKESYTLKQYKSQKVNKTVVLVKNLELQR